MYVKSSAWVFWRSLQVILISDSTAVELEFVATNMEASASNHATTGSAAAQFIIHYQCKQHRRIVLSAYILTVELLTTKISG